MATEVFTLPQDGNRTLVLSVDPATGALLEWQSNEPITHVVHVNAETMTWLTNIWREVERIAALAPE